MEKERKVISVVVLLLVSAIALGTGIYLKLRPEKGVSKLETAGYESLGIVEASKVHDNNLGIEVYKVLVEVGGFSKEEPITLKATFDLTLSRVLALEIASHKETEGIGSKIMQDEFLKQFVGTDMPFYTADAKNASSSAGSRGSSGTRKAAMLDGVYKERAKEPDKGYYSQVEMTVDNGVITSVVWDSFNEEGVGKTELSMNGQYVMTEDGLTWAEQAAALADYVIAKQGLEGLTIDDSGKTDAVTGVSISINSFVEQVEKCMEYAAMIPAAMLDGAYKERAEELENGYYSQVEMTVEKGAITSVVWDSFNEEGVGKTELSMNGQYVMTEDGLTWAEQAAALADYVIANQGINGLSINESGKTDAVTGVSININSFVKQVQKCMENASSAGRAVTGAGLSDGTYTSHKDAPEGGYANDVIIIVSNQKIISVLWEAYNEKGTKRILSQNGGYVMTENGATWAEQADALAAYVIEKQGLEGLNVSENGKTDAVAGVSISITDFTTLLTECLVEAAKGGNAVTGSKIDSAGNDGIIDDNNQIGEALPGTEVDAISGATVSSKAVIKGINNAYEFLKEVVK